jgi:1,4-dihydroxy-2-naphthoate octaprenyltransferase
MAAVDKATLDEITDQYGHAVVVFLDADGYPLSVASDFTVDVDAGAVMLTTPLADAVAPGSGSEVNVIFSHINPQPGVGYDQRRYVSLWGTVEARDGSLVFTPQRSQSWDENKLPFFEYSEVTVPQAHRYMGEMSERQGRRVRPQLDFGWLALRTTRAPFLTATLVPILLGIAVAALDGHFRFWLALLTVVAGSFVHLGLNVANDVFDTRSGADAANTTPTQFSGGSRVALYGLIGIGRLAWLSAAFYAVGLGLGLYLAVISDFWPVVIIGAIGFLVSVFYTAPPIKLVHRGLGELAVFAGFGPIMLLGAYWVQAERFSWEALWVSVPVGILIALILYVNEIPDRSGDSAVGKNTLPVRWSKDRVIFAYALAATTAFTVITVATVTGAMAPPAILGLAAIPLALQVVKGLRAYYDEPYALMGIMGKNIQLHAGTGMLLFVGYVIAIIADRNLDSVPAWLGG